jgi:hypothetical protein
LSANTESERLSPRIEKLIELGLLGELCILSGDDLSV